MYGPPCSSLLGLAFRSGRVAVAISPSLVAVLTLIHQPARERTAVTLGARWKEGEMRGEKKNESIKTCKNMEVGMRMKGSLALPHSTSPHFNLNIVLKLK